MLFCSAAVLASPGAANVPPHHLRQEGDDTNVSSSSSGWYHPSDLLRNTSAPFFIHELELFLNATKLSYVSTSGGYFENWTVNESVNADWVRSQDFFLNPAFGLRALMFWQFSSGRILIVFRGTDLTNDLGGLCDQCADQYLWGNVPYSDLPPQCHQFSEKTLDYLKGAMDYANDVQNAFPFYNILFTGHSLGAGLAAAVSSLGNIPFNLGCAPPNAGAIMFSPPGYIATLMNRSGVDLGLVDPTTIVALVDQWDPVWVGCNASLFGGLMGQVCQWYDGAPSAQCVACDAQPSELPMNTSNCQACMMQRHAFSHYLQLRTTPPVCSLGPRQECYSLSSCWTSGGLCVL